MEGRISWDKGVLKDAEGLKKQIRCRKAYKILFVLKDADDAVVANVIQYAVKRGWRIVNPDKGVVGVAGGTWVEADTAPSRYIDGEEVVAIEKGRVEWFPEVLR